MFYSALVTWLLWKWFAIPIGLPAIGYWHLCGLGMLVSRASGTASGNLALAMNYIEEHANKITR